MEQTVVGNNSASTVEKEEEEVFVIDVNDVDVKVKLSELMAQPFEVVTETDSKGKEFKVKKGEYGVYRNEKYFELYKKGEASYDWDAIPIKTYYEYQTPAEFTDFLACEKLTEYDEDERLVKLFEFIQCLKKYRAEVNSLKFFGERKEGDVGNSLDLGFVEYLNPQDKFHIELNGTVCECLATYNEIIFACRSLERDARVKVYYSNLRMYMECEKFGREFDIENTWRRGDKYTLLSRNFFGQKMTKRSCREANASLADYVLDGKALPHEISEYIADALEGHTNIILNGIAKIHTPLPLRIPEVPPRPYRNKREVLDAMERANWDAIKGFYAEVNAKKYVQISDGLKAEALKNISQDFFVCGAFDYGKEWYHKQLESACRILDRDECMLDVYLNCESEWEIFGYEVYNDQDQFVTLEDKFFGENLKTMELRNIDREILLFLKKRTHKLPDEVEAKIRKGISGILEMLVGEKAEKERNEYKKEVETDEERKRKEMEVEEKPLKRSKSQ